METEQAPPLDARMVSAQWGANLRAPNLVEVHGRSVAVFSPDMKYRYILTHEWEPRFEKLVVVGLNPSTATAEKDDPTIRRCISFARREGFGGLVMLNLFAWRATDPRDMHEAAQRGVNVTGELSDRVFAWFSVRGRVALAAWGVHPIAKHRADAVVEAFDLAGVNLRCLGRTMKGAPRHPLYVKGDQPFEVYP